MEVPAKSSVRILHSALSVFISVENVCGGGMDWRNELIEGNLSVLMGIVESCLRLVGKDPPSLVIVDPSSLRQVTSLGKPVANSLGGNSSLSAILPEFILSSSESLVPIVEMSHLLGGF